MKIFNKECLERMMWGPKDKPFSLRKQLSKVITFCCMAAICIQAVVMVSMLITQYVQQERLNTIYILESDNMRMDTMIQYLEEMALSIQHNTGLHPFLKEEFYSEDHAMEHLKNATSLFSERNRLETSAPFVEKVYLFNLEGDSVYHLYYPTTIKEIRNDREKYKKIFYSFLNSGTDFYYQVEDHNINLCLWLYDSEMNPAGVCVFSLNRAGIERNYENLEKMRYYSWSVRQGENIVLEKETISRKEHLPVLEQELRTGFGLTLSAGVSCWVIYKSLSTTVLMIVLISIALILLLSFLGHALAVYYVQPLETVAEKIKLVGEGNFDTKLSEYRVEELQNISHTFNEMTDYIDRLVKEVYETQLIAQQAQIQYLQAQMNPHFLFNVLSMIEMKAAINGDHDVKEMIYKLSKLYQGKIFRRNEYFIRLAEEMEIVDFYLSLQNRRFGEKITYAITYDGDKDDYKTRMVPRLSIEPIVENAVCHGLEPKDGNGHIRIQIREKDDKLWICIKDNGVGFNPDLVLESSEDRNHSHVGLWNTNKMIHNLCGDDYGLQVTSEIGRGTEVFVILPIKVGGNYVEGNDCR